jgi:hypothetical protein
VHPRERADRPRPAWPPHQVRTVCEEHLALVDRELPGLVEGLYLHGSLGFGEWYDGRSDVDFVAVTSTRPDAEVVRRLEALHGRLEETFPRPPYDGFYVTWDDLARPPYQCPDVACTLGGQWQDEGRVDVNPVTWHELARHGVEIRGPRLEAVELWTDQQALRAYTHANLETFWTEQAGALRQFPQEAAKPEIVSWFVLGVPRLHHLLATDRLTSKNGAGQHAVDAFGERWRPLVAEALAYRGTGERAGALVDEELGAQVMDFADLAVRAGLEIPV